MLNDYIPIIVVSIDGEFVPIGDIFSYRNIITKHFSSTKNHLLRYKIKSGDTPRSLANTLYLNERYDWIIYCANMMINPYYEWPLSEDSFYEMLEDKYFNKTCFFLKMNSFGNNFTTGETITSNSGATAQVVEWNRNLCKLTVNNITGLFESNNIITSNSSSGTIGRIIDRAEDALHVFESPSGKPLNTYAGFLQAYIASTNELYAVTSKQYEEKLNDSKRDIYVLKPDYVRHVENFLIRNIRKIADADTVIVNPSYIRVDP